jgi:hypothetical protein
MNHGDESDDMKMMSGVRRGRTPKQCIQQDATQA